MKPVLILQHRYLDEASNNEFEAILKYGELSPEQVQRVRMEESSISDIVLDDYSAIVLGGGPSNISDPPSKKSVDQLRFESELENLYKEVYDKDFPYLGMCYGMGSLTHFLNGEVTQEKYGEGVGAIEVELTENATKDPLLEGIPSRFTAFAGHKESCGFLPRNAVHLARSKDCPFQMIRTKTNLYATQFHPELDQEGLVVRVLAYRNHGYFPPGKAQYLIDMASQKVVTIPQQILRNFIKRSLQIGS